MEFKVGDLVKLKSGGPVMTVESVYPDEIEGGEIAGCVWFEQTGKKQTAERQAFQSGVLEHCQKPALGVASGRIKSSM